MAHEQSRRTYFSLIGTRPLALAAITLTSSSLLYAQQQTRLELDLGKKLTPVEINRYGLGIGGFTDQNPWKSRVDELRALNPRLIRLFVQEYYDLLPAKGEYNFEKLDRSVDLIRRTGAEPLLCITFKPKVLFPRIDNDLVEPTNWKEWEDLIQAVVSHYQNRGTRVPYWEVGNEVNLASGGGTPYHFSPKAYYRFYRHTVSTIRRADPTALVGGPGLAGGLDREGGRAIVMELLTRCAADDTPIDFLSWHGYNNDATWFGRSVQEAKTVLAKFPSFLSETVHK